MEIKLNNLIPLVQDQNIAIIIDKVYCGTKESFSMEIMRGGRLRGCRKEYIEWLNSLNLNVSSIGFVNEDAQGNKNLLCIHCAPIEVKQHD